jgi:hypothetical protein
VYYYNGVTGAKTAVSTPFTVAAWDYYSGAGGTLVVRLFSYDGQISQSSDGFVSFTTPTAPIPDFGSNGVLASLKSDRNIIAAMDSNLYKLYYSLDAGQTWSSQDLTGSALEVCDSWSCYVNVNGITLTSDAVFVSNGSLGKTIKFNY